VKQAWIYIIGIVLVAAAIVGIVVAMNSSKDHSDKLPDNTAQNSQGVAFPERQACAIFSLADAKQVLGDTAKGGNDVTAHSSDTLTVSSCSYNQDSGNNAAVSASNIASLKVSAPKTGAGSTSNQNQFGRLKPANSQPVSGYGDTAYWDAQNGQLDILKHNTWYIVSNGPVTPSARTLDQAKILADILIAKM
jgi:hypothetical protein